MIRFEHVTKRYADGTTAVDGLSFEVAEGELVTLVGPSGCGKTTTMKMVNRLIEPTEGRIFLDGDDISAIDPVQLRRRIGYVIQQVGLFPHKTVLENTATVPHLLGWKRQKGRARAANSSTSSDSILPFMATAIPNSSPADSANASASPGRSPPTRRSC